MGSHSQPHAFYPPDNSAIPSGLGIQQPPSHLQPRESPPADADGDSIDNLRAGLYADDGNPNEIITSSPKDRFKLGYLDVMCLIVNRMIGTGIFNSPQRVVKGTNSTGASLLLWFVGIIYALSGTHVYIEYGLSVPRYTIHGVEQSVPRSGGDLNYLAFVYRKPAYRSNTMLLTTFLFGISFIILGNVFSNCINCALQLLAASGEDDPSNGKVRGIAVVVATLSCFIHVVSRRGGILLNNFLALVKLGILVLIVITAIVVGSGGFPETENVIGENTDPATSFHGASDGANGFAHAFLAIMFSLNGFDQANYVLGEIGRPRRKFPVSVLGGVGVVLVLYLAVNISYMVVVRKEDMMNHNVAERFFDLTFGTLATGNGHRIFSGFLAISSLGNIIVMTYTAARVKQEIAKEGILPYAKFFAQNKDLSLGRLLYWFQKKGWMKRLGRFRFFSPEEHTEKTPVGALVLHLASCLILIFATYGLKPHDSYALLTSLASYVINGFFGTLLGVGILILRFKGPPPTESVDGEGEGEGDDEDDRLGLSPAKSWTEMTGHGINPILSTLAAVIFTFGSLYPTITAWIPPSADLAVDDPFEWWLVPTVSWSIIALSVACFVAFVIWAWNLARKHHRVFVVERRPEFEPADRTAAPDGDSDGKGGLVLVHETVYLSWVGRETLRQRNTSSDVAKRGQITSEVRYAGSEFDGFGNPRSTNLPIELASSTAMSRGDIIMGGSIPSPAPGPGPYGAFTYDTQNANPAFTGHPMGAARRGTSAYS